MKNEITFEGQLLKKPKVLVASSGKHLVQFTLVNTMKIYNDENEIPIDTPMMCETWGELADRFVDVMKERDIIQVTGKIQQQRWKDGKMNVLRVDTFKRTKKLNTVETTVY